MQKIQRSRPKNCATVCFRIARFIFLPETQPSRSVVTSIKAYSDTPPNETTFSDSIRGLLDQYKVPHFEIPVHTYVQDEYKIGYQVRNHLIVDAVYFFHSRWVEEDDRFYAPLVTVEDSSTIESSVPEYSSGAGKRGSRWSDSGSDSSSSDRSIIIYSKGGYSSHTDSISSDSSIGLDPTGPGIYYKKGSHSDNESSGKGSGINSELSDEPSSDGLTDLLVEIASRTSNSSRAVPRQPYALRGLFGDVDLARRVMRVKSVKQQQQSVFPSHLFMLHFDQSAREKALFDPYLAAWAAPAPLELNGRNMGGNVGITPPFKGYPLGRVYYGTGDLSRTAFDRSKFRPYYYRNPPDELAEFFAAQKVQHPFSLFSQWLLVGHVDEIVSFIPWKQSSQDDLPFRILIVDTNEAMRVLRSIYDGLHEKKDAAKIPVLHSNSDDGSVLHLLTGYPESKPLSLADVVELREVWHQVFHEKQRFFQDCIDVVRDQLTEALELDPAKSDRYFIKVPMLFNWFDRFISGSSKPLVNAVALYPDSVNHLLISDRRSPEQPEAAHVHIVPHSAIFKLDSHPSLKDNEFLRDPLPLAPTEEAPTTVWDHLMMKALKFGAIDAPVPRDPPPERIVRFVNDYYALFRGRGDVHCGTNTIREPFAQA